MPYINEERKYDLLFESPRNPGELNFTFTETCKEYIDTKGLSYQTINDIIGALECCKQEFYRRVAVPYEEEKIKSNGDVY